MPRSGLVILTIEERPVGITNLFYTAIRSEPTVTFLMKIVRIGSVLLEKVIRLRKAVAGAKRAVVSHGSDCTSRTLFDIAVE